MVISTEHKEKTGRKGLQERNRSAKVSLQVVKLCWHQAPASPSRNVCLRGPFSEHDVSVHSPVLQYPLGTGCHSQGSNHNLAPGGRQRRESRGTPSRTEKVKVKKGAQGVMFGRCAI